MPLPFGDNSMAEATQSYEPLDQARQALALATGVSGAPPAASLAGTMTGGGAPVQALPRLPQGQSLQNVLQSVQQTNAMMARANEEAQRKPPEIVAKHDPTTGRTSWDFNGLPAEDVQQVFQALQFTRRAMQSYDTELTRLRQQEQNLSTGFGPIGSALAHLGANLAIADPRLPPIVRALGMTAKEINPTIEETRDRELQVASGLGGLAEKQQAIISGAASRAATLAQQQLTLQESQRHHEETEKAAAAGLQEKREKALDAESRLYLKQSGGRTMPEAAFSTLAKGLIPGISDEDVHAKYVEHQEMGKDIADKNESDRAFTRSEREAKFKQQQAMETQRLGNRLRTMQAGVEFDKAKKDYSNNLKLDDQWKVVSAPDHKDLIELATTEKYLDTMEAMVKDPTTAKYAGLNSVLGAHLPVWAKGADRTKFEEQMARETPRVLKLISEKGGTSLLRTEQGIKLVQSIGAAKEMRPAQTLEIIQNLRGAIRQGRQSIVQYYDPSTFRAGLPVFGRDVDLVSGGGQAAPAAGGGGAGGAGVIELEKGPDGKLRPKQ